MEQNNNQNNFQNKEKKYWLELARMYSASSVITLVLVDNEARLLISIAPALEGKQGKPQAGVPSFDYNQAAKFTLNYLEIAKILYAHDYNLIHNNGISFIHNNKGSTNTLFIANNDKGLWINISNGSNKRSHKFQAEVITNNSNIFIPTQYYTFINILKGIMNSFIDIRAGMYPERVSNNKQNNYSNYNNNFNNGYNENNTQQNYQQNQVQNNQQLQHNNVTDGNNQQNFNNHMSTPVQTHQNVQQQNSLPTSNQQLFELGGTPDQQALTQYYNQNNSQHNNNNIMQDDEF